MSSDRIIGIDLGTTNSCVAVFEGAKPVIVPNSEGFRTTPSVVSFVRNGERLVGLPAKRQAVTNPGKTILSVKRCIGTNKRYAIDNNSFSPEQISAMILQKLKADTEAYLGETVSKAVITVPAYFNNAQRQATKDAGRIAGLEVLRIINEPTASSLAYGINKGKEASNVLVYDLGGGTFDVSVLRLGDDVYEVKSTAGNNSLGGDDFDQSIIDWLVAEFRNKSGIDLSGDLVAMSRLKEAAEKAKIELSSTVATEINLPFIAADGNGPKHLEESLNRVTFNEITRHLVESTMGPVKQALADAKLNAIDIDNILLVGGSSRIVAVQEILRHYFGKEPCRTVNPDEAVAIGAALQGAVLGGDSDDVLLLDVIPLSLGIETNGELFTRVIARNTTIPTSRSMNFTTSMDGQTAVQVHVLQGERELARDNVSLAKFTLEDIPRAPKGCPQIKVTFEVDADGILHCHAVDQGSGLEHRLTIRKTAGLSPAEVERMTQEAELYAQEDKIAKQRIEARVKGESLLNEARRTLDRYQDRASKETVSTVNDSISNLEKGLKDNDEDLLKLVLTLESKLLILGREIHTQSGFDVKEGAKETAKETTKEIAKEAVREAPVNPDSNTVKDGKNLLEQGSSAANIGYTGSIEHESDKLDEDNSWMHDLEDVPELEIIKFSPEDVVD